MEEEGGGGGAKQVSIVILTQEKARPNCLKSPIIAYSHHITPSNTTHTHTHTILHTHTTLTTQHVQQTRKTSITLRNRTQTDNFTVHVHSPFLFRC